MTVLKLVAILHLHIEGPSRGGQVALWCSGGLPFVNGLDELHAVFVSGVEGKIWGGAGGLAAVLLTPMPNNVFRQCPCETGSVAGGVIVFKWIEACSCG